MDYSTENQSNLNNTRFLTPYIPGRISALMKHDGGDCSERPTLSKGHCRERDCLITMPTKKPKEEY
jgi:hypothetical protein